MARGGRRAEIATMKRIVQAIHFQSARRVSRGDRLRSPKASNLTISLLAGLQNCLEDVQIEIQNRLAGVRASIAQLPEQDAS